MPKVDIQSETDIPRGWRYVLAVTHDDGSVTTHRLRLAWVDHNHWAGDRTVPPSRVAQALIECLARADLADPLPERFDAATARRWVDGIDEQVRALL